METAKYVPRYQLCSSLLGVRAGVAIVLCQELWGDGNSSMMPGQGTGSRREGRGGGGSMLVVHQVTLTIHQRVLTEPASPPSAWSERLPTPKLIKVKMAYAGPKYPEFINTASQQEMQGWPARLLQYMDR